MNEEETYRRQVIAALVRGMRRRKFKTVENARQAAQVSRGTWDAIERGQRVKEFTLAAVEEALGILEGTFEQILDGNFTQVPGLTPLDQPSLRVGSRPAEIPTPESEWYERVVRSFEGAMRLTVLVTNTKGLSQEVYDIAARWRGEGMRLVGAVLEPELHGADEDWPASTDQAEVSAWLMKREKGQADYDLAAQDEEHSIEEEQGHDETP